MTSRSDDGPASTPPETQPVYDDIDEFRIQMIEFMREMDTALSLAMQHPVIAEQLQPYLLRNGLQVPFSVEVYGAFENLPYEALENLQRTMSMVPGAMSIPDILKSTMLQLPAPPEGSGRAARCGDPYAEFNKIVSRTETIHDLNRARNGVALAAVVANTAERIADASSGECELIPPVCIQVPTSWIQATFIVIKSALETAAAALEFAADEYAFQVTEAEVCINDCVGHGLTERHRTDTAPDLRGRGCDNRDNNCSGSDHSGGIDEIAEDLYAPKVTIDAALTSRCWADESMARAVTELAIKAEDDCVPVEPSFTFTRQQCLASVVAEAEDLNSNRGMDIVLFTVDDTPPLIELPPLDLCYPDLASARAALSGATVTDCTAVEVETGAVEKECVADLELLVTDECGNRSIANATVLVDDTPPDVNIETLLLPNVGGLACFASAGDALATVAEAARLSDNCTAIDDLELTIDGGDDLCNFEITTTVEDACGFTSEDGVVVRVDDTPPVVMCAVEQALLWPPDEEMADIGFSYVLSDNCDGSHPDLRVQITSDEPTSYNLRVHGEDDATPDAVIERTPDGGIARILLRAQRRQTVADDGRVYRIRLTATDSCGLSSRTDCYVTVPKTYSPGQDEGQIVNSGQFYDVTEIN